jgi:hypothetical protein
MTLTRPETLVDDVIAPEPRVDAEAVVYRLYDVGYEIHLEQAFQLLASSTPERPRPVRGEAQAIQIPNPPVTVGLGVETVRLSGEPREVELSARLFDFGVVSLRARLVAPPGLAWSEFAAFGAAIGAAPFWGEMFARVRVRLLTRIAPAIERPGEAPVVEDYVVFRVNRLEDGAAGQLPRARLSPDALRDEDVARLLLGELRPLSGATRRELLSQRFSYFEDDLTVLTWNSALIIEPVREDADIQYVLEFANAQLLELRFYDARLDGEIPKIYDRIEEARRGFHLLGRGFNRLLAVLQTRVADATELVERVENSLKVTDDVFLARIYSAALEIFRGRTWRTGIDRKIAILRETYGMLNAESQARRSEVLEIIIVVLIVIELVLALWKH